MITPVAYYSDTNYVDFLITNIVGGTTASVGNDIVITFTQSGSFQVLGSGTASVLTVGGGAGGNTIIEEAALCGAGGGGGGGVSYYASLSIPQETYQVEVGAGGQAGIEYIPPWSYIGGPGGNSYIRNSQNNDIAFSTGAPSPPPPAVTITDGRQGGNSGLGNTAPNPGYRESEDFISPYGAGGSSTNEQGQDTARGGNGYSTSISGTLDRFGGGGGGGVYSASGGLDGGDGGFGGGGDGGSVQSTTPSVLIPPTAGVNGKGGGGGGGSLTPDGSFTEGANGGSGVVIIRYTP